MSIEVGSEVRTRATCVPASAALRCADLFASEVGTIVRAIEAFCASDSLTLPRARWPAAHVVNANGDPEAVDGEIERSIVGTMSPLDHCVATLRALTIAADSNGVVLAERAIDAYAMNVNGSEQKIEALRALRTVINPTEGPNLPAWAFAEVLVEYVDQQIRALESPE